MVTVTVSRDPTAMKGEVVMRNTRVSSPSRTSSPLMTRVHERRVSPAAPRPQVDPGRYAQSAFAPSRVAVLLLLR